MKILSSYWKKLFRQDFFRQRIFFEPKIIIATALLFISSFSLLAQEYQTSIGHNFAYPQQTSQRDFSTVNELCEINNFLDFTVTSTVEPDCEDDNGSIEITINATDTAFEYFLNGELIDAGSDYTFSFDNLEAGGYSIEVVGNNQNACTRFVLLSNAGQDFNDIGDDFEFSSAYCGLGKLKPDGGIVTEPFTYKILNSNSELLDSCNLTGLFGLPICNLDLEPGTYYIERLGGVSNCQALYEFEIEEIPTTNLPFLEDFAAELVYPSPERWADKDAFVNRTFPINPLSVGVATLDGLDEQGRPYQTSTNGTLIDGPADSLTSLPFCFDGLIIDTLHLSFYFQPQGNGDIPNQNDSLIVEVKDNLDNWYSLWSFSGAEIETDTTVSVDQFTLIRLEIVNDSTFEADQTFFEDGFQFRFRNTATLNGLNDTYHLDFIRVDLTPKSDYFTGENTFVYDPMPILSNYSSMPWRQFYEYQDKEFVDSLVFSYRFNGNPDNPTNLNADLVYNIYELCEGIDIDTGGGNLPSDENADIQNETLEESLVLLFDELPDLSENKPEGSNIIVQCEYAIDPNSSSDEYIFNDTVRYNQIFSNYMSYDDGTAEKGYGFVQTPGELAIQYEVNEPDMLEGVQIYFTHIVGNGADQQFGIKAWHSLDFENEDAFSRDDSIIAHRKNLFPIYPEEAGQFSIYLFDEPVSVDSVFYIGFEQQGLNPIEVGHDVNNLVLDTIRYFGDSLTVTDTIYVNPDSVVINSYSIVNPNQIEIRDYEHRLAGGKTFINGNGVWEKSILAGAVMIRPILSGQDVWQTSIESVEIQASPLRVYPNPSNGLLNIETENSYLNESQVRIFDYSGKVVKVFENQTRNLSVQDLPTGMYMIQLVDLQLGETRNGKFVKQ